MRNWIWRIALQALAILSVLDLAGCEREKRSFTAEPSLQVPAVPETLEAVERRAESGKLLGTGIENPYEKNAYAIAEGERLYRAYNCVGCHAHGGGGIGPALMDTNWIYGYYPERIYAVIVQGTPNGMPSFQRKIPEYQVWQIVAYVRSMSQLVKWDALPGRGDEMWSKLAGDAGH